MSTNDSKVANWFDDDSDDLDALLDQVIIPESVQGLETTLEEYFGFSTFRSGQKEVITSLINGKDAVVLWATGLGKSMCYQIPALHTKKTAFVISPLISLMEDQCNKLNGLSSKKIATFLGGIQTERDQEEKIRQGDFLIVYMTPERVSSWIEDIGNLHNRGKVSMIAIDEAHCVSEWGHDFRPSFRRLYTFREHPITKNIPIAALTATAVPKVQADLMGNLRLRNPIVSKSSCDRTNLKISCFNKGQRAMETAMKVVIEALREDPTDSSIVYCPTRKLTEQVTFYLKREMGDSSALVTSYHAGMSASERHNAHIGFLVGDISVIVATIAFGMGIDKPDIRRIIHFGPPKTMESYYQQIGRAGRDGLPSECIMYSSPADFTAYTGDFYVGGLTEMTKAAVLQSLEELRQMATDPSGCRRAAILKFFDEVPSFGERCGTCDNCTNTEKYGGDLQRTLWEPMVILTAIHACPGITNTQLMKILSGKLQKDYVYRGPWSPSQAMAKIAEVKANCPNSPASLFKELMPVMQTAGYVTQQMKKVGTGRGFSRSYATLYLSSSGRSAQSLNRPILVHIPLSMREEEEKKATKLKENITFLEESGVNIKSIPVQELKDGNGEIIATYLSYHKFVARLQENDPKRAKAIQKLHSLIIRWRKDTAVKFVIAPASVLAEHIVSKITLSASRVAVNESMLREMGVRISANTLAAVIGEWTEEHIPKVISSGDKKQNPMILPEHINPSKWKFAACKEKASWRKSVERFLDGDSVSLIAGTQVRRPILPTTVVGHLLDGLVHGIDIPLNKIGPGFAPSEGDWEKLEKAEDLFDASIIDTETVRTYDFLEPICSDQIAIPYQDRSPEDAAILKYWWNAFTWFSALRRCGYVPSFGIANNSTPKISASVVTNPKSTSIAEPTLPIVIDLLPKPVSAEVKFRTSSVLGKRTALQSNTPSPPKKKLVNKTINFPRLHPITTELQQEKEKNAKLEAKLAQLQKQLQEKELGP